MAKNDGGGDGFRTLYSPTNQNVSDLSSKLWTVPAERIKAGREHRVPLSDDAVKILRDLQKHRVPQDKDSKRPEWIFKGNKNQPLSNMAMLALLRRMDRADITVHGFRSSFRDWAAEQTNFPREVAEAALAHISGDKVELAYLRSDFFDKRRQLMNAWACYCQQSQDTETGGKIVKIGSKTRRPKKSD